jgi:hypothetical protein
MGEPCSRARPFTRLPQTPTTGSTLVVVVPPPACADRKTGRVTTTMVVAEDLGALFAVA